MTIATKRENETRKYVNFFNLFLNFSVIMAYIRGTRVLEPELHPLRDLASPYFLIRHTFVTATVFWGIKLI